MVINPYQMFPRHCTKGSPRRSASTSLQGTAIRPLISSRRWVLGGMTQPLDPLSTEAKR